LAGLGAGPGAGITPGGGRASGAAQRKAILWVRWRLFVNAFRRKGGKGEVIARAIFYPIFAVMAVGPIAGAFFAGYQAIHGHTLWLLNAMTWAVFAGWAFVTLGGTLAPPNFDMTLLLRFPMRFRTYLVTRFGFGLLLPVNVIATLSLCSAALGVGVAEPRLFAWSALVLLVYALCLVLLLRTALLWTERWMAQRRTREIVTSLLVLLGVSFQFVNVWFQRQMFNRRQPHAARAGSAVLAHLAHFTSLLHPLVAMLPPSLAASAIGGMVRGRALEAMGGLLGVIAFSAALAALYAQRLYGEFRGENFDEAPARAKARTREGRAAAGGLRLPGLSAAVTACIEKELLYLKRGPSMLLGTLMPLILVAFWGRRMSAFGLALPGAVAYTMFGLLGLLYNGLGRDAAGAQLYLLSPTPLRQVFLAKNLVYGSLIVLVAGVAAVLVSYGRLPSAPVAAGTALWFLFALFANLSFGNMRSLTAPTKMDMGRVQTRQQVSQLSVLMMLGVLFGSLLIGVAVIGAGYLVHVAWAAPAVFAVLAPAAVLYYVRSLKRIGELALAKRDVLIEVLCKV
jgi:ABC-2 type transport system permease protein